MKIISKKINYEKALSPIYVDSVEASNVFINEYTSKTENMIQYKIKGQWVDFKAIKVTEAVLPDSLFLRYMNSSITRNSSDKCQDFIVLKFNYDAIYQDEKNEYKKKKEDLRTLYYKNGVDYTFYKKNRKGEIVDTKIRHFKMLMRSPGKAKDGECVFVREELHHKAINFLTMGLYDLMDKQSKNDPEKVFKLVELSAYLTLTTATAANGYIHIPLENILIIKDEEVYTDPMRAAIVRSEDVPYLRDEFVVDFDSPRVEKIINKHGYSFDREVATKNGWEYIAEKSKESLKNCGIRINGKYPGSHREVQYTNKECTVTRTDSERIKNVMWDGMGLIDSSIFPEDANGFIYCRSHFFKSCLFGGNIQKYFQDYCKTSGKDYNIVTMEDTDMFHRPIRMADVQAIITDKSIKWLKFIDLMGGTEKKAYKYYRRYMKEHGDFFSIVKTAHSSKWGNLQLTAYQMNNSLPTTNKEILGNISHCAVQFLNNLKQSDKEYLKYLNMTKNRFNVNEVVLALVERNPDFVKTSYFREKKKRDISRLKNEMFSVGRLPQEGDNLTVMGNPIALLMKAVGVNPLDEGIFQIESDVIQCYTTRFKDGERLAAFRSPHNSPNNILHLHNIYSDYFLKYFPDLGQNVIVVNMIGTDIQARASGLDEDSDFLYVTNQRDLASLARKAYLEYPTIINDVKELETSGYHFTLEDFANMDNKIADAQESIGASTDTAQLALSYYYDGSMDSRELEDCFVILSVIGQISIDLAKKCFDINVVKEINRIKRLPCMGSKLIPDFLARAKKLKNNKEYENNLIKKMNCPMDIMAEIIGDKVITYADRVAHEPLRKFLNHDIKAKGNRYKQNMFIEVAKKYNEAIGKLENNYKQKISRDAFIQLKNKTLTQALSKVNSNLDQNTIMYLVCYALDDKNKDVQAVILNFLYKNQKEQFLNCFVKSDKNRV